MTDARPADEQDAFAAQLEKLDRAVADGSTCGEVDDTGGGEMDDRVQRARQCLELIDRVRRSDTAGGEAVDVPVANLDSRPRKVGRFEIVRELGRGGYGVVYLAMDPALDREVALKVPRPEVLVSGEIGRFLREGKAVAALNHANIVPVYEAGQAGPICYIASAFSPGMTLARWLAERESPVPSRLAAQLLVTLAEALQHAHGRGVVHRDLKPGNVLLEASEERALPKPLITDFGLAKWLDSDDNQTRTGGAIGTPSYMAPEQAAGQVTATPAMDIYALGAILYELLTGRPPFRNDTVAATLRAVEFDQPLSPVRHRRHLPRDLASICLKCLEKNPSRRYGSATELAADLARFLRGEVVRARHIGSAERLWRAARRNPVVAALIGGVAASLLVGTGVSLYFAVQASRSLDETRLALLDTRREIDRYVDTVQHADVLKDERFQPLRRQLLGDALQYYRQFIEDHRHDPHARLELADTVFRVGELINLGGDADEALKAFREAKQLYEQLVQTGGDSSELRRQLGKSSDKIARILHQRGELPDARTELEAAVAIHGQLVTQYPQSPQHPYDLTASRKNLGRLFADINLPERAMAEYQEALRIERQLVKRYPREHEYRHALADTHGLLGVFHGRHNRPQEAAAAFQEAAEVFEQLAKDEPTNAAYLQGLGATYDNIAAILARLGKRSEALDVIEKSIQVNEGLAFENPTVINYQFGLAVSYTHRGALLAQTDQTEASLEPLRRAAAVVKKLLHDDPQNNRFRTLLGSIQLNYGSALRDSERLAEAVPEFDAAIGSLQPVRDEVPGELQVQFLLRQVHVARGRVLDRLERHAEALLAWRQACALEGPRSDRLARVGLALSLCHIGEYQQAVNEAEQLAIAPRLPPDQMVEVAAVYSLVVKAIGEDQTMVAAQRATLSDAHAQSAIALLRQARDEGYFSTTRAVDQLCGDNRFQAIKKRDAFSEFIQTLAK